jgi:TRAP-type C4-dicarboxylate transport system permease small subunit
MLHRRIRRRLRSALTTVEYALMLFFFAVTALFGFPTLSKTAERYVGKSQNAIGQAEETR